jgi:hypothetical protein
MGNFMFSIVVLAVAFELDSLTPQFPPPPRIQAKQVDGVPAQAFPLFLTFVCHVRYTALDSTAPVLL